MAHVSLIRKIASIGLVLAALVPLPVYAAVPNRAAQVTQPAGTASLAGTATGDTGQVLAKHTVQLRNLDTGLVVATTTSDEKGEFSFTGVQAGAFVVEVVNSAGVVIATTGTIAVTAGATITGITLSTAAKVALSLGGGGLFGTTATVLLTTATAIGITGAIIASGGDTPTVSTTPPIVSPAPPPPAPPPPAPAPPPPAPAPPPPAPAPPPPPPPPAPAPAPAPVVELPPGPPAFLPNPTPTNTSPVSPSQFH
jgi:hypothetical protein